MSKPKGVPRMRASAPRVMDKWPCRMRPFIKHCVFSIRLWRGMHLQRLECGGGPWADNSALV